MPNEDRSSASGESDLLETRRDSLASVSQYSTTTMKVGSSLRPSKSTGAMGLMQPPRQHLETLAEENGSSASPPVVEGLKLPVRSKTTPGPTGPTTRRKRSIKTCVRCGNVIDDGRWVAIDNGKGGVLCEKDWKEMYLPKCRRCGLTIESQAVSSADGQLKGKYHRECFSCSTCQKPFPDKSFYVFGGQPYCDYHYHQANNSLCANPICGKPIEGPCAEDHEGCRYHPEHLTCAARDCRERLVDYYEVDGLKYCEKHVDSHRDGGSSYGGNEDVRGVRWLMGEDTPSRGESDSQALSSNGLTSAMKRRTRFLEI
ncbi:hypothetical protein BS47DRAFT_990791 [Hydnum rufescens UP504]|uniref:LIM zinc-binding domain-containing protein n=1 Tax=Hydnum rufescens UP504 TaxID=1448309 RepID=A0A9P6AW87_9AGAM|nr:hypothetical protein BS47DRAFT_990791 [Hydnum rufescens UP504]